MLSCDNNDEMMIKRRKEMLMIILNNDSFVNYDLVSDNMQLYSHAIIMDSFVNFSYRKGN